MKTMSLIIGVLFASVPAVAQGGSDTAPEISGYVRAAFQAKDKKDGRSEATGKLKVKTDRTSTGTRAVIAIKGESREEQVILDDAYFDHETSDDFRLRVGVMKKVLGRGSYLGATDRMTPRKSLLVRYMEERALVGRSMQIEARWDLGKKEEFTFAIGNGNAGDSFMITHYERPVAGWLSAGAWLLIQADRIDNRYQPVWAAAQSFWGSFDMANGEVEYDLELAGGTDPHESEFQRTFGDGKSRLFYGATLGIAWNRKFENGVRLGPFAEASLLIRDHTQPAADTPHGVLGVAYQPGDDLRITVSREAAFPKAYGSTKPTRERVRDDDRIILQATHSF